MNAEISCLSLVVLLGGKYLKRNLPCMPSHVFMDSGESDASHLYVVPLGLKGNNCSLIASSEMPFALIVAHICKNHDKCSFVSSSANQPNWTRSLSFRLGELNQSC